MKAFGLTQKLFSSGGHPSLGHAASLSGTGFTAAVSANPLSRAARSQAAADLELWTEQKKKEKNFFFVQAPSPMPSGFAAVLTGIPAKNVTSITLIVLRRMKSGFCPG